MNKSIDQLKEKIELFRNNIKDYKGKNYDEYNTRADFIDTVFSSLGWDMYNEQGVIEQFREVIREDNVEIEGKKKKPDYSFKIGPQIVFYVEAKKPSVDIKNDPEPAYQLRRYAHTQGLKLSILTDFEEIAVYDTRIKPSPKDSSAIGRIFYCTYDKLFDNYSSEDYETNFDFLLNTFSKQAILNGSFDRYAEENKNKKGTASVDKGFLELLNKWREILAANIALKNENIDEYNLNIAVQKIIDRLVFLRIAEDRLIEEPNFLISKTKKENVYEHLLEIFIRADDKYNSGLFISEDWLKSINIDDNTFKVIIEEMYYPKCPYEFSVLPIEILGNAYEQFLGKTIKYIRKTKYGHKIEIEEKPEVRKAGGVYYTPSYIVNYIVENTVGKTIEGLTPEEIKNIKIVDPACGSGSFLIGAYNYLLRYNLEFHLKNETKKKSALKQGIIYQVGNEIFKLSTAEKSKILVNNIFGVDIDQQAVEVTRLSLLLKVLEDENLEYKEELFKAEHHHLLPDLSENIKCGNSLIGNDFYKDRDLTLFGNEEIRKINTFDWEKEFSSIIQQGGFNCVIGNPPYVKARDYDEDKSFYREYLNSSTKYKTLYKMWDLYIPFVEKGCNLLKSDGLFSMIIPDTIENSDYAKLLRNWLLDNYYIKQLDFFPKSYIFYSQNKVVGVKNTILLVEKASSESKKIHRVFHDTDYKIIEKEDYSEHDKNAFKQIESDVDLFKVESIKLGYLCFTSYGLRLNSDKDDKKYSFKKKDLLSDTKTKIHIRKYTEGKYLERYNIKTTKWLEWNTERCPAKLVRPTFPELYNPNKILLGRQTKVAALDTEKYIVDNTIIVCFPYHELEGIENRNLERYFSNMDKMRSELEILSKDVNLYYILGIINSKLIKYYINYLKQGALDMYPDDWKELPIPVISKNNEKLFENLINNVMNLISTKSESNTLSSTDRKHLETKINAIDENINDIVFKLYNLSDDERNIISAKV